MSVVPVGESANKNEYTLDDPGGNRSKGHRSVVLSQDRIQADRNARGGSGPNELDERCQYHPVVVRRQPGEIDRGIEPNGTILSMLAAEQAMKSTPTAMAVLLYEGIPYLPPMTGHHAPVIRL